MAGEKSSDPSYDVDKIIELIQSRKGDTGRLEFILECIKKNKKLYNSDKKYLESKLTKLSVPEEVHLEQNPLQSIQAMVRCGFGDIPRLQHIYTYIIKNRPLYKSDQIYLDKKLDAFQKNFAKNQFAYSSDTETGTHLLQVEKSQRCQTCFQDLSLDDKLIRKKQFWYHQQCVPQDSIITEKPTPKPKKIIQYVPPSPKIKGKRTIDPVLVLTTVGIFGILLTIAFSMFTYLSIIAIIFSVGLIFFQILGRIKYPPELREYGKNRVSVYGITILILPFVFGSIIAFDGYLNLMTIGQAIFVWMLTLSFWQTFMFVPLAVRSKYREMQIPDPKTFPVISVIVPAYNEEKVIQLTIDALLETEYPNKEIILVDDGSKDKTLEIGRQYKDKIKVLHKENGGKASALNFGLLYCSGEIVCVVDADTVVGRHALLNLLKGFDDERIAAVAGNIKIRNKVNWITWCQALEYLSGIQIMRRALDYFGAITIVPGALGAFRKSKLEEIGSYHKQTMVEDFDATMKVLKSGMVVQGSSNSIAYTQAPQTLKDFYNQRKRWYRGNLQVLTQHSDALTNPRFGSLHRFSYPLMIIHMLLIPAASLLVWGVAIYQIVIGNYLFVAFILGMFILLQYLLTVLAVRMDNDDKKIILYSVFFVIGYKQLIDILQLKAVFEEIMRKKAVWTSAKRVRS